MSGAPYFSTIVASCASAHVEGVPPDAQVELERATNQKMMQRRGFDSRHLGIMAARQTVHPSKGGAQTCFDTEAP